MKDAKGHGSEKHLDANGQALKPGDRVRDRAYHEVNAQGQKSPIEGNVTRTYFAGGDPGGDPGGQPLLSAKFGGTTVTRSPSAVEKIGGESHVASIAAQHGVPIDHLRDDYNRDLALRSRNGQVGSGMKFRG